MSGISGPGPCPDASKAAPAPSQSPGRQTNKRTRGQMGGSRGTSWRRGPWLSSNSHTTQFAHLKYSIQGFVVYSDLGSHHHGQVQNILITPKRKLVPPSDLLSPPLTPSTCSPLPQPLATANLLPVSIDFPVLGLSYTWEQTLCGLL